MIAAVSPSRPVEAPRSDRGAPPSDDARRAPTGAARGHGAPGRAGFAGPGPLVVIGCGAAKLSHAAAAADLYTGQHFRLCLATALDLAPCGRVLVLSARYGLVGLGEVIAPYDLTVGQPGAVDGAAVAEQLRARGLTGQPVTALCSARYVAVLRAAGADVSAPLAGLGIGRQRGALSAMRRAAASAGHRAPL